MVFCVDYCYELLEFIVRGLGVCELLLCVVYLKILSSKIRFDRIGLFFRIYLYVFFLELRFRET